MNIACSLLIPCRNAAGFLPNLFAGVGRQVLPFAEIVLWDDGSTDDSAAVGRKFGARVVRREQNAGPAVARNELANVAACEWIHFHDADDLITPEFLDVMSAQVRPDTDVVACDADWIDAQSRQRIIAWRYAQSDYLADPLGYLLTHPLGINNCIYRRDAFLAAGGFRREYVPWEDADFHVRLAAAQFRFAFIPQVLTQSVRHAGGISMDYRRSWNARLRCLQDYATTLPSAVHPQIASEAARAAAQLALLRDPGSAAAIELCRSLGGDPLRSTSRVLHALDAVLPTALVLRIQERYRQVLSRP